MNKFSSVADDICAHLEYEKPSYLGAGQFKEAYKTADGAGATVALKVFDPDKCNLCRAEREISAMQQCESPVIGRLYIWGTHEPAGARPHLYIVEEFFGGGTLTERVASLRDNVTAVCTHGMRLMQAVAHLRDQNLVHRDIKPDNIMFRDDDDGVALVDFGLVRDLSGTSLTHSYLSQGPGTPYFASPEQLNNDKSLIDWRSDQFAVGVVLSICLTGMHPYGDPDVSDIDVVNRVASRARHALAFVEAVEQLGLIPLLTMTSPWPVERFSSPWHAIEALRTAIERSSR